MVKIGVTERGDGGVDFSWVDRLNSVDGAIIITKNICSKKLREYLLKFQDKLIIHANITTLGSGKLEPNVKNWEKSVKALVDLINYGFNPKHIVYRLDSIIYSSQVEIFEENIYKLLVNYGIKRFRFSFVDFFPHVKERFFNLGIPLPSLCSRSFTFDSVTVSKCLQKINNFGQLEIESCGEYINTGRFPNIQKVGCVSEKDLKVLGIKVHKELQPAKMRKYCQCLNCKVDLLETKHPCVHGCVYCYWKN